MPESKPSLRLIVAGTGPFAVPMLEALWSSNHHVLALVTRPIEDAGKRRKTAPNPMRDCGQRLGIPISEFSDINAESSLVWLREQAADLLVVCDFGQLLSDAALGTARLGGINLHGSLLPRYRGAAPVAWAIYHGESITGVTVIHMTRSLDGGPIIASSSLTIDSRETAGELEARLAQLGPDVVLKAIEQLAAWDGKSPCGTIQDSQHASSARRLRKGDGLILWKRSAQDLANQVRAFQPWPGSFTFYHPSHRPPMRLILLEVEVVVALPELRKEVILAPGEVARVDKHSLWVQTGDGLLAIRRLQPAGKGPVSIEEFLRGHRLSMGERFACETVPNNGPHS